MTIITRTRTLEDAKRWLEHKQGQITNKPWRWMIWRCTTDELPELRREATRLHMRIVKEIPESHDTVRVALVWRQMIQ
jgi:hypothetical protein